MANLGHFDADNVDTNVGFDPVPPGDYTMIVSNSDVVDVKDKPGQKYLKLEHTIVEGEFKDRKVWSNLNLWNANAQAVKIAEGFFGQLCKAVGKRQIQDSAEVHGIPFLAKVGVEKQEGRNPQNKILKYYYEDEKGKAAPASNGGTSAQPVSAGGVPWANG